MSSYNDWSLSDVLALLARLHRPKDRAYGDAWRKRGEVIAIFANIARKYDRLEVGLAEDEASTTETLGDTAGDLCVYAGKYLTWLAETQPRAFAAVPPGPDPKQCAADRGHEALEAVFAAVPAWQDMQGVAPPETVADAFGRVCEAFAGLEAGLLAQADPQAAAFLGWEDKVALGWRLTDAAAWLLLHLGRQDAAHLNSVAADVARMEAA